MPRKLGVLLVGDDEEERRVSGSSDTVRKKRWSVSFARARGRKDRERDDSLEHLHPSERHELGRLSCTLGLILSESKFCEEKRERSQVSRHFLFPDAPNSPPLSVPCPNPTDKVIPSSSLSTASQRAKLAPVPAAVLSTLRPMRSPRYLKVVSDRLEKERRWEDREEG